MGNRISGYDTAAPSATTIDSTIRVSDRDARTTLPKLLKILESSAERVGGTFESSTATSTSGQNLLQTFKYNFPSASESSIFAEDTTAKIQASSFFTIEENPVRSSGIFGSLQLADDPDQGEFSSILSPFVLFDDNIGLRLSDFGSGSTTCEITGIVHLGTGGDEATFTALDKTNGAYRMETNNGGKISYNDEVTSGIVIDTAPGADLLLRTTTELTIPGSIGNHSLVEFFVTIGIYSINGGNTTKPLADGGDINIKSGDATPISPGNGGTLSMTSSLGDLTIIPPKPQSSNNYARSGDINIDVSNGTGGEVRLKSGTPTYVWPNTPGAVGTQLQVSVLIGDVVYLQWA